MTLPASSKCESGSDSDPCAPVPWTPKPSGASAASSGPALPPRRLRDDPRLIGKVQPRNGALSTEGVVQGFSSEKVGTIEAGSVHEIGALVVVTDKYDLMIDQNERGNVLTGKPGNRNYCRIIFKHAFVSVRVELSLVGPHDAHIGFLEYRNFEEVQTFSVVYPRGARSNSGGGLRAILEYRAGPLCELQGIVWRGGLVQIESIALSP